MNRAKFLALCALAAVGCGPRIVAQRCPPTVTSRANAPVANAADPIEPAPLLAQRVEAIVRGAAPSGARFTRYVAAGFLTERQSVTHAIDVPRGTCVSIVAYASPAITDLDARVYDGDGELLVEDVEPDAHPTVQLCGDEARRVFHVAQAFEGEGAYAIAMFTGDRRAMDAIARVVGGRPGTAISTRNEASSAERRTSELRASLQRRGFAPIGDAARVTFANNGAVNVPLSVSSDRCYTFAAIADEGGASADLRVFDSDDELLAFDTNAERDALVQLCPSTSGPLRLEVRGAQAGAAVVSSFAADAASFGGSNTLWLGDRTSIAVSPAPLDARLASLRARWLSAGYVAPAAPTVHSFAAGESRETSLSLEPGRCSLVAAVAGRGVGRLNLSIFDDAGTQLARGPFFDGSATTVLCPPARERVLVRQRIEVGSGDVALVVAPSSNAASLPWASGADRTLVSEALSQPWAQDASWRASAPIERFRVAPGAARAREFDLSAGACTRVVVSVAPPFAGVSLTLRGPTGAEFARSSGQGTARITHCVVLPTHARLEVELDARADNAERDAIVQRFERPDTGRIAEAVARP
ncbi:MAG: hypothetical protein U0269_25555 [Polyangiales bacterium]